MTKYKYSSDWIHHLENQSLWNLYWYQQKLLENNISSNESIAEIGVGSKFTSNYLKSKNYSITTIDIDSDKKPDIVLNVVECNPSDLKFDVILAFNIFEHIPYQEFLNTVNKFNIAGINKIFCGIPVNRKTIIEFKVHLGRYLDKEIKIYKRKNKITAKHHHWEIDYKEYTFEKVLKDFAERNYYKKNSFIIRNQAYFYFQKEK